MTGICSDNGIIKSHTVRLEQASHRKPPEGVTKVTFRVIPGHQDIFFNDRALRRLKATNVARRTGSSVIHLALAWALHRNGYLCTDSGRTIIKLTGIVSSGFRFS